MVEMVPFESSVVATPRELLGTPLEFLLADHLRQRVLCKHVEQLVQGFGGTANMMREVIIYMTEDMPLHVQDEEESLFPLLRNRCKPEDEIERVLARLSGEHTADARLAEGIVRSLVSLDGNPVPIQSDSALQEQMRAFARAERYHLALENSLVLPLARVRLTASDLQKLSSEMAERRGLPTTKLRGNGLDP